MRKSTALAGAIAVALGAQAALAADVTSKLKNGTLTLTETGTGTVALVIELPAEMLAPRGIDGVTIVVDPEPGTTVDGSADPALFEPVENLKIKIDGGTVTFAGVSPPGSLDLKAKQQLDVVFADAAFGDDVKVTATGNTLDFTFDVDSTIGDDLTLKAGGAADTIGLAGGVVGTAKISLGDGANLLTATGTVGDDVVLKGGGGVDQVVLDGVDFGQDVTMSLGKGVGSVTIGTTSLIGGSLKLKGGSGVDTVTIDTSTIGDDVSLSLSSGNNTATLTDVAIGDDLTVKAGGGDDTVTLNGVNTIGGQQKFNLDGGTNVSP
jgi:hypothetical protein